MAEENQILSKLSDSFDYVQCPQGIPCDYAAWTKNQRDQFYIIIKSTKPTIIELKKIYDEVILAIKNKQIDIKPVVVFIQEDDNLQFGIIIYWDDKKPYLNKDVLWRTWNEKNAEWFNIQIHARRMQIDFLPNEYLRVLKIIELNDDKIIDGRYVYLRNFTDNYKMKTPPVQTDEERFHRLLNGTPEEEYPADELDDIIYNRVKEVYPLATKKSGLLLFHTDLVELRLYKDYSVKYASLNLMRRYAADQLNPIDLECYYHQSIFKGEQTIIRPLYPLIVIDDKALYEKLKELLETYHLISEMII